MVKILYPPLHFGQWTRPVISGIHAFLIVANDPLIIERCAVPEPGQRIQVIVLAGLGPLVHQPDGKPAAAERAASGAVSAATASGSLRECERA